MDELLHTFSFPSESSSNVREYFPRTVTTYSLKPLCQSACLMEGFLRYHRSWLDLSVAGIQKLGLRYTPAGIDASEEV